MESRVTIIEQGSMPTVFLTLTEQLNSESLVDGFETALHHQFIFT